MIRKIIPVLCMLVLAGVFSCSDNDPVAVKKNEPLVAPPPRTINVNARLQVCLSGSQVANVYVRINGGSWTLVNSVPSTSCTNIGSFSASNGDTIEFYVREASNPFNWTSEFRCVTGFKCPGSGTTYCGDGTFGTIYSTTLVSTVSEFSIQVSDDPAVANSPCGSLYIC